MDYSLRLSKSWIGGNMDIEDRQHLFSAKEGKLTTNLKLRGILQKYVALVR